MTVTLPRVTAPEYSTHLVGIDRTVRFRPFLVGEEKLLLLAMESDDQEQVVTAVRQVFDACIIDEDLDSDGIPFFDFEDLFLRIREVSVSDVIVVSLGHPEGHECEERTEVSIPLTGVRVSGLVPDRNVAIDDTYGVRLRFPSVLEAQNSTNDPDGIITVMAGCMELVYELEGDGVWPVGDVESAKEWIEHLSRDQFQRIADFFENVPRLTHEVGWTCEKCGETTETVLSGLRDFFD